MKIKGHGVSFGLAFPSNIVPFELIIHQRFLHFRASFLVEASKLRVVNAVGDELLAYAAHSACAPRPRPKYSNQRNKYSTFCISQFRRKVHAVRVGETARQAAYSRAADLLPN